jgi:hypothetical protein
MNFKKIISLYLTFFLLFSNIGTAFTIHYCDDEIASISLTSFTSHHEIEEDCCGVIEKKSNCCHNKIVKTQEKQDQIVSKHLDLKLDFCEISSNNVTEFISQAPIIKSQKTTIFSCFPNAPPLYKLYSQYIFYS